MGLGALRVYPVRAGRADKAGNRAARDKQAAAREVIAPESILVTLDFSGDRLIIRAAFRFADEDNPRQLNIAVDPVGVEVVNGD